MAVGALESNAIGILPGPYSHTMPMLQGRAKTSEAWALGAVLIRDTGEIAEAAADPVANVIGIAAHICCREHPRPLLSVAPWHCLGSNPRRRDEHRSRPRRIEHLHRLRAPGRHRRHLVRG